MRGMSRRYRGGRAAICTGLAALIGATGLGVSAGAAQTPRLKAGKINIGVCAAFTGGVITYGQPWLQGVQVAADDIAANGGVNGHAVNLVTCDTKGDPVDAVTTVRQMLANDQIKGEVGLAALDWQDALPIFNRAKIVTFTHIGSPDIDKLKMPYSYSTGPSDALLGTAMVYYAHVKHYKRIALLFDATSSSQTLVPGILAAARKLNIKVVANPPLPVGAPSYEAEVQQVLAGHPDAILTQVEPNTAGTVFSELQSLKGGSLPVIGSDLTLEASWSQAVGTAYYQAHVLSVEAATNTQGQSYHLFIQGFLKRYHKQPNYLSVYAYDGMTVEALAMVAAHSTDPTVYSKYVLAVTAAGSGKTNVYSFGQGAKLLAQGKQIKYVGVGSPMVYNSYHRVTGGFAVEQYTGNGQIKTLSQIPANALNSLQN